MNLQHKKARVSIAALGVTALIAGAGALTSPVFAAGAPLTITPTTTTVNTVNLGAAVSTVHTGAGALTYDLLQPISDATYSLRVTSAVASLKLSLDSYTPPVGATAATDTGLYYAELPTTGATAAGPTSVPGATAAAAWAKITPAGTPVEVPVTGSSVAATKNVFLAAAAPGTYVVHFVDPGAQGGTDDDSVSPSVTLNVKDAYTSTTGAPVDLTDDWAPAVTNSAHSVGVGAPLATTVGLSSLTLADARGTSTGVGVLASKIAALVGVQYHYGAPDDDTQWGTGNAATYKAPVAVNAAGIRTIPVGVTILGGTITATATLDAAGNGIGAGDVNIGLTDATTVTDNSVTTVPGLVATSVVGSVMQSASSGAVAVKTGVAAVTYTATVAPPAAGKVVYFTVYADAGTPAVNVATVAKLSTNGTAVDVSGTTSKIYSATTSALGVASLTVTSSDPKALDTYKVKASSNGHPSLTYGLLTTTYADAAGAATMITSTVADLTPATTVTSVTIKGKVTDQFGAPYQPASTASQQAQLYVGTTAVGCTPVSFAAPKATAPSAGNATIAAGVFSFTYTPTTTPVSGTCTPFGVGYDGNASANITTAESDIGSINWASTVDAGTVTLTSPTDAATAVNLSRASTIAPGQSVNTTGIGPVGSDIDDFGAIDGQVTGTVVDASNAALPYKTVVLTGTAGVYFSTSPTGTDLVSTLTVVSNNLGVFGGGYAFFTNPGTAKVTATVGTVKDDATLTTDPSTDPFKVTVNDATGTPGSTLIVTGSLMDFFGHPVPNWGVNLSIGTSTVGGLTDSTPTTNPDGIFSTSFITGANQSGDVKLAATIPSQTVGVVPAVGWTTIAKLTGLPTVGEYTDQSTISVTNTNLTLSSTGKLMGGGEAKISGSFLPKTSVDIYSKASGAESYTLLDSVMTDAKGDFGASYPIKKSTGFLAKANGLSSKVDTTVVYSTVKLTAKSTRHHRATLMADGGPKAKGTLTFYRSVAGKDPILRSMTSNSFGNGTVTVTLPKGIRGVYVIFKAPGTAAGTSKTVKVNVK
jgi:hypothetical protein